jgi:hypothetical protein
MQILRHAKIATAMDIYAHVPTRATRVAVDALGLLLAQNGASTASSLPQKRQREAQYRGQDISM